MAGPYSAPYLEMLKILPSRKYFKFYALFWGCFMLIGCSSQKLNRQNISEHCFNVIRDKIEPVWHTKQREAVDAYYRNKKNPPLNQNSSYSAKLLITFDAAGKIVKINDITLNRNDFVSNPAIKSLDGLTLQPQTLNECFQDRANGLIHLEWEFILKT